MSRYKCNELAFSEVTIASSYWAGFIAADGCIIDTTSRGSKILKISLSSIDKGHIKKFVDFLNATNKIIDEKNGMSTIKISSNIIVESLFRSFNIIPRKTFTLSPPEISVEMMRHFIRGYFDGDGCFTTCSNGIKKYLSWGLLGTLSITSRFNEIICSENDLKPYGPYKLKNIYRIQYGGEKAKKISDWMYKNVDNSLFMDRKFNKRNSICDSK